MDKKCYATCLWPGLTDLWWRGQISALPYAIAFTLILNIYLVIQFIYPEWLPASVPKLIFWIGVPTWVLFVVRDFKTFPQRVDPGLPPDASDLYNRALAHRLRRQYAEAEGLLTDMLAIEPRDPPALLLLAGLYRETDRFEASDLLLREMKRLEVADQWWLEIEAEQRRNSSSLENRREKAETHRNTAEVEVAKNE